jgi:hypothetical protein
MLSQILTKTLDLGNISAPDPRRHGGTDTVREIWSDSTGASNFRDLSLTVAAARIRPARRH